MSDSDVERVHLEAPTGRSDTNEINWRTHTAENDTSSKTINYCITRCSKDRPAGSVNMQIDCITQ